MRKSKKQLALEQRLARVEYVLDENVTFEVKEAFRNFKASLSVSMPKKTGEGSVIMMTSACPGDGKTTVAVNLALTFAMSEAKVVLVDADIRKGRVARYFKTKSAPGLADYLSGQVTLDKIVRKATLHGNLDYICCGTHSPRPFELLESDEMKSLLAELKNKYDYVVLDTPPLLVVSDAIALVPASDGAVLVCRHEMSSTSDIAKAVDKLQFAKANILGTVVNDYTQHIKTYAKMDAYKYYANTYIEDVNATENKK